MARKISFTKAERDAVEWGAERAASASGAEDDQEWSRELARYSKALRSLLAKMDAEPEVKPPKDEPELMTSFREAMGDKVVWPVTALRWAQLKKTLIEARWSEAEMRELDLSWADSPIPASTVAARGREWLVTQRAKAKVTARRAPSSGSPALLPLDDEDE